MDLGKGVFGLNQWFWRLSHQWKKDMFFGFEASCFLRTQFLPVDKAIDATNGAINRRDEGNRQYV